MEATAIYCEHGKVRQWECTALPGEALPEIEHCEVCDINSVLLDGGTFAPDEVPGEFATWVQEQIQQKRQEGDQ